MTGTALSQNQLDIEYHRTAAKVYDDTVVKTYAHFHRYHLHPWINRLVKRFGHPHVLDIGCGTGFVSLEMAKRGCIVTGVDHSPEMLNIALQKALDLNMHPEFIEGDIYSLPYPDGSFDAVTIHGVLHHLEHPALVLKEAARLLRHGGELYISEPCLERTPGSILINRVSGSIGTALAVRRDPVSLADHEGPISAFKLISNLRRLELTVKPTFLAHLGFVRFLPPFMRIWPILALSLPVRRKHGDIALIVASKPHQKSIQM